MCVFRVEIKLINYLNTEERFTYLSHWNAKINFDKSVVVEIWQLHIKINGLGPIVQPTDMFILL